MGAINKSNFQGLIYLLMTNATGHIDEVAFQAKLVEYILQINDIKTNQTRQRQPTPMETQTDKSIQEKQDQITSNMENSLIEEEDANKVRMFFQDFKESDEFKNMSKIQILEKIISRHESGMTIRKFIKAFRHDHAKRFAFKQVQESKNIVDHTSNQKSNKKAKSIIPQDTRKYKEGTLRDVLGEYTFSPDLKSNHKKTERLVAQREEKLRGMMRSKSQIDVTSARSQRSNSQIGGSKKMRQMERYELLIQ